MPLEEALDSYIINVLASAPDEMLYFGEPTAELPITVTDAVGPAEIRGAAAGVTVLTARIPERRRCRDRYVERSMSDIVSILGREILDSRGNPTVEVEVHARLRIARARRGPVRRVDRRARGGRAP